MASLGGPATNDAIVNAESQFGAVIAICVSFSVVSVVFLGLRLYTRLHLLHYAGTDDFTIVIAEVEYGFGVGSLSARS